MNLEGGRKNKMMMMMMMMMMNDGDEKTKEGATSSMNMHVLRIHASST